MLFSISESKVKTFDVVPLDLKWDGMHIQVLFRPKISRMFMCSHDCKKAQFCLM